MKLFAQIRKVDEQKRLVFGRLAHEAVDKADEIMDYESSKPHFQKWSEDISKDTDGKSLGNLRAMHGKVAAGKFTQIDFNDAEKAIDVCAKVVDDNEWKKVLEGVYTGFSIGGSYVGEKKVEKSDGRDVTRYTAKPSEGSLVDRPCIPSAKFFEVQKADGSLQKVDFQALGAVDEPDVTVKGTAEEVAKLGKMMNEHGLTLADLLEKAVPAFVKDKVKDKIKDKVKDKEAASEDPDAEADAAGDKGSDGDADEDDAAKAEKLAADATEESLVKLEASLADALVKVGARNSSADVSRIKKIHDMTVELGAACAPATEAEKLAKVEPVEDLAKAEQTLQKLVADAVEPLNKLLAVQADQIKKLEAMPAAPSVRLRAVSKADDVASEGVQKAEPQPIIDDHGDKHDAAGLIKMLHSSGGTPLAMPATFRK